MIDNVVNTESEVVERLLTNKVDEPDKMTNQDLEGFGVHADKEFDLTNLETHRPVQKAVDEIGESYE